MGLHIVKICVEQGYLPYDAPPAAYDFEDKNCLTAASLSSNEHRPVEGFDEVLPPSQAMGALAVTTF